MIAMHKKTPYRETERASRRVSGTTLLLGVAGGLAAMAWLASRNSSQQSRRYADRHEERRNPLHFFLAGKYPRRRKIDLSGKRPLFERRQSVYEAY
jgi:hypothetical protein